MLVIVSAVVLLLGLAAATHLYKRYISLPLRFKFYTKQGLKIDCYSPTGGFFFNRKFADQFTYGDPYYAIKKKLAEEPDADFYMTHVSDQVALYMLKPEYIKLINIDNVDYYRKAPVMAAPFQRLIGLFAAGDHPRWKDYRKVITQCLHHEFMKKMIPIAADCFKEYASNLEQRLKDQGGRLEPKLWDELRLAFGESGIRLFFGNSCAGVLLEDMPIVTLLGQLTGDLMMNGFFNPLHLIFGSWVAGLNLTETDRRCNRRIKEIRRWATQIIEKRRKNINATYDKDPSRKDLLQILLEHQEANKDKPEERMSDGDLIHWFTTFMVGSTDSITAASNFMLYYLTTNPKWMKECIEEVDQIIKTDADWTVENLIAMKKLEAVFRETIRIIPPAGEPFYKEVTADIMMGKYKIKKGTILGAPFTVLQTRPEISDPLEFKPERWLSDEMRKISPYLVAPFGVGRKMCIGQTLANYESKLAVGILLKNFNIKIQEGYELKIKQEFALTPQNPVPYILTKRKQLIVIM
eukprot:TRINITY_DN4908_c0_g2_i2.p2 TRINITY_DN4908_c0_g2~~TRINITY_DN4908_c0_g2_i2.p2  ORF type:complete len:522 (+),score=151.64 TRINITY_DN4908_c0_g2_i2:209-1774(+)